MSKPTNGANLKRQKELVSEWLELSAIEDKKSAIAKELFELRGNKPFLRGSLEMVAIERINKRKLEDGTEVEVNRTYQIRRKEVPTDLDAL